MRALRQNKDASKLQMLDKFFFVGNKNEIFIYRNWLTGRTYAQARFEYDETFKCHLYEYWFELTKSDMKDDEAIDKTIENICKYFGYFNVRPNPFNLKQ
jgi:hypothetical protein